MENCYIVFDVETPNSRNDRMSAIGLCVVQDGEIIRTIDTLVNPECRFDAFNIALTGITPAQAAEAPTFPELWPILEPYFSRGILVAHNAPFDLSVLGRCLRDYGIEWRQTADYLCTVRMTRRCLPELPNHKLNTLSEYLGIGLEHHRAGSDTKACAAVLLHCLDTGAKPEEFRRTYDLTALRTMPGRGKGAACK